ncbi:hypothetical protein J2T13_000733 [Paenibacillus sp. DS2015]|uniref:hypothetical protein n=1 Tax=Paenibacillus sp. DS2015 TaxID=3373917 RepID=UPI003D19ABBA
MIMANAMTGISKQWRILNTESRWMMRIGGVSMPNGPMSAMLNRSCTSFLNRQAGYSPLQDIKVTGGVCEDSMYSL